MDFFAAQESSRGKTTLLVFLFAVAVTAIVLSVYTVVAAALGFFQTHGDSIHSTRVFHWFRGDLFFAVSIITILIIILGSIFKIIALGKGGGYVAESLGGRLVNHASSDTDERKLINVVEEMAIASGIPVPQIYVLDNEEGINAFAAGYSVNDAVVAVTRGCMKLLTRDELQGVVAHEFSHIFNGDMRLNIRIIGLLSGILIIANIGYILMRTGSRGRKGGGQIAIAGLGLLAVGYIGVFAGRIIQSAISRQREYLADASAVQFTRNPLGIANALKKIGGFIRGSKIKSPSSSETCHLFFAKAISSLFATHPPLPERIRRIDPSFRGEFKKFQSYEAPVTNTVGASRYFQNDKPHPPVYSLAADTDSIKELPGNITQQNMNYSTKLLAAMPLEIRNELEDIFGASSIVCALLLEQKPDEREIQLNLLRRVSSDQFVNHVSVMACHLEGLDPCLRLPILDLSFPALRQMSNEQYETLKNFINVLIEADKKITLYEFSFREVIEHRLKAAFNASSQKIVYKDITKLAPDIEILISALAFSGKCSTEETEAALRAAMDCLPFKAGKRPLSSDHISFKALHDALRRFAVASPGIKKMIFNACVYCVLHDKKVTIHEAELLRAIAYSMDIPLPPFVDSTAQDVSSCHS